jgi:hypothetical protein
MKVSNRILTVLFVASGVLHLFNPSAFEWLAFGASPFGGLACQHLVCRKRFGFGQPLADRCCLGQVAIAGAAHVLRLEVLAAQDSLASEWAIVRDLAKRNLMPRANLANRCTNAFLIHVG